jgi:putative hydrolase of HD superfamily
MKSIQEQIAAPIPAKEVVQRQLDAYNAGDIEAWLATYHQDAEQRLLHGGLLATGHDAIRKRMIGRFSDHAQHARLISRTVMDKVVVDHELVTRTCQEGIEEIEMICIYEVDSGKIVKASFAIGQSRPKP